jgi:ACS family sodium-dependent inorganic phosphate cotransporter
MRNALAALIVFMSRDLSMDAGDKGRLLSAIAAGYLLTQVPGGAMADRFGAKMVISFALTISAFLCFLIPFAADSFGLTGVWCTIALMGAAQGPLFPTSTVYLSRWMPKQGKDGVDEKAWGTTMLDLGVTVGSMVVLPVANALAETVGWRQAYRFVAVAALAFVAIWLVFAAEEPSKCGFISGEELKFLSESVPPPRSRSTGSVGIFGIPLETLFKPGLLAVFCAHMGFNYGFYFLTNWSPTYYADVLKLSPAESGVHLAVPQVANIVAIFLAPALVKLANQQGFTLRASRCSFTAVGLLGAGLCLCPAYQLRTLSPWVTTVLLALANGFFGLSPSGFKANYLDVTELYVGVVSGYGNTLGTCASFFGPQIVGFFLKGNGGWDAALASIAAVSLISSGVFVSFCTVTPVERQEDVKKKQ